MTAAAEKRPPLLERVGVQYFERRASALPTVQATDAVHFLNPEERKGLRRVLLGAVSRSALAGAISASVSAVAELYASSFIPEDAPVWSLHTLHFWAIVGGATAVASVLEILFIYWDTLRSVHQLAHVAGLNVFGPHGRGEHRAIAAALARAALELPNPIDGNVHVNPLRESSKAMLLAASLAYKAKIGVTNFLFKMIVRRMLGRILVRSTLNALIPFVAVPITALWNGIVTRKVLEEAKLRAMGPSAAEELVGLVFAEVPALSDAGRLAAVRAIASAIVRTQDLHPNVVALLEEVRKKAGDTGNAELDDVGEFLESLATLTPKELRVALQLLAVAIAVDGKVTAKETRLYTDALQAVGRPVDLAPVVRLTRAFVHGEGVAVDALNAVVPAPS